MVQRSRRGEYGRIAHITAHESRNIRVDRTTELSAQFLGSLRVWLDYSDEFGARNLLNQTGMNCP
jgi:hypothetical protein